MRTLGHKDTISVPKAIGFGCDRLVSMFCYGAIVQLIDREPTRAPAFIAGALGVLVAIALLCGIGLAAKRKSNPMDTCRTIPFFCACAVLGVFLIALVRISLLTGSLSFVAFCAGCLMLSIGSAGLFFCWGIVFSQFDEKTVLAEFSGGFVVALIALVPLNLVGAEAQTIILIVACCANALLLERAHSARHGKARDHSPAHPKDVPWIRKKIYSGMGCYGVAMGLSTSLLPHTGQAVYFEESVVRLICGLVVFGAVALFASRIRRNTILVPYRMAYLIIALNTAALLLLPSKVPLFLAALFVGHLLIITTCMSLLFTIAGRVEEDRARIVAFGTAAFLFGDLSARAGHDLLAMTGAVPPEPFAFATSISLVGMIIVSYALVFNERDVERIEQLISDSSSFENVPIIEISYAEAAADLGNRYGLTAREREVFALLLAGRSSPRIQSELFISESTVHTHTRHIYAKTGVRTRQELLDLLDLWVSAKKACDVDD